MGLYSLSRLSYGPKCSLVSWTSWRKTWHPRLLFHTSSNLDENFPNINLTGSYLRTRGVNNPTPSHRIIRCPYPDITFPNEPLHEFVWSGLSKWHDMKALTCASTGRSYTYARARDVSHRFAVALLRRGLRPGDTVAVCLPNAPEYPLVFLGALEAGMVITALATNCDEGDMRTQLSNARPVAAVGAGHLLRRLVRAGVVAGIRWKVIVALEGLVGAAEPPGAPDRLGPFPPGCLRFEDLVSAEEHQVDRQKAPQLPYVKMSDVAVIPFTGGTTGPAKGVRLSHANIVTSLCQIMHEALDQNRDASESFQEELVCSVPFYHIYGMFVVMAARMRVGAHIVTTHNPTPEDYLRCLQQTQSTALNLTPSLLLWLAKAPLLPARHLDRVHTVMCGGSPLAADNVARFISRLRPSVSYQQGYGCTETTTAITQTSRWERSLGTAGFVVPNTRVKVVEAEGGDALGAGHTGEILVKGPQVMVGYLNDEAATQRAFDSEGWFRTGDLGFYDDEHRFHVVDRLNEVIRVSGMHTLAVAPAELEQLLRSHPGVGDAAVVSLPHHAYGEVPRAFVVRAATTAGARITERELLDLVSQRTPPYKHLVGGVEFVDSLPKAPTGIVKRYLLKGK